MVVVLETMSPSEEVDVSGLPEELVVIGVLRDIYVEEEAPCVDKEEVDGVV